MEKRGQGAQFNWVFILVAGVIVLGFFTVFIFKYVELENKKSSFIIVDTFNTQLDLLERTSVFLPNLGLGLVTKMEFICSGDNFLVIVNDHEDLAYNLGDKVVFAPDIMRDKTLGAWIYEWNYPFLVSKFLFLTSSEYKYIFVGSSPEEVDKIPDEVFDYDMVSSVTNIKDPHNTKVVFFSSNNNGAQLVNQYEGLEAIYIDTQNKKVTFYGEAGDERTFDYLGDAFFYGAIFAGSAENYECAMNSAIQKLKYIGRIYSGKTYLHSLEGDQECIGLLGSLDQGLDVYKKYQLGDGNLDKTSERLKEQNLDMHGKGCRNLF